MVHLDRYVGSCNTLNDLSNNVLVPKEREDLNLRVFNMITGINESNTLTKHISCKCKCKFDGRKSNSNQTWNNGKCWCEWKNLKNMCTKKIIFGILLNVVAKMVKKIQVLLMTQWDETIPTKTVSTDFNEKEVTCKKKNLYFTHLFINYHSIIDSC